MKKTMAVIAVLLSVAGVAMAAMFVSVPRTQVLAPNALHTTASREIVSEAIHGALRELRIKHFTDKRGVVRFQDGTSIDKTTTEWERGTGSFVESEISFEDFQGRRVTINNYSKSENDALIVWRYEGGGNPQDVSAILQERLAKAGKISK
jgi:hypothetical protein